MRALRLALKLVLWLALAGTAGLCAALAIGSLWGRVDPEWDVGAQFTLVWLAACLACLLLALLFRGVLRWSVAAACVAGLLACAALMIPEFLRSTGPHARPDAPGQIRIVQFNIWEDNPHPEAIWRWLDAEQPDIAVVEEDSDGFKRQLAAHPQWHAICVHCEVTILSRRPGVQLTKLERYWRWPWMPLTGAMFHDADGDFEVVGVHDTWPTQPKQFFQEMRLFGVIATTQRPSRLIVTGDFNSTPWSFARRRWDEAFGLPRRDRAVTTWPARANNRLDWFLPPFLPIDHVYAGSDWATVKVERGPRLSSDHFPLVVTLAPVSRP